MVFRRSLTAVLATVVWSVACVQAATVPFTEDFAVDNANWQDADSAALDFAATGGPDGGSYVTGSYSFVDAVADDTPILLRGQGSAGASGGAYMGDWISDGVTEVTAWVRHNSPVPLNFFARIATPFNFPAGVAIDFVPVLPNTWTKLTLDVSASSVQFVTFEGSNYNSVFSNIGNIQFGAYVPAALEGYVPTVTVDLDQPTITPEPASLGMFAAGALAMLRRRR